jgi:hypothetical protein
MEMLAGDPACLGALPIIFSHRLHLRRPVWWSGRGAPCQGCQERRRWPCCAKPSRRFPWAALAQPVPAADSRARTRCDLRATASRAMSCRTTSLSVGNHWRRWDPFPFRGTSVQMTHDLALLLKQQGSTLIRGRLRRPTIRCCSDSGTCTSLRNPHPRSSSDRSGSGWSARMV